MENDQRLTPLPLGVQTDIQAPQIAFTNPGPGYQQSYDGGIDSKRSIRQYLNVVYKRLPTIMALTVIVTAAAAFYSYRQPSIYQARAQMTIEPRAVSAKKDGPININFGDDRTYYNTQLRLMKNPELMKRVVVSLGLYRDAALAESTSPGLLGGIRSLFSGAQKKGEQVDNSLPVETDTTALNGDEPQLTAEEKARVDAIASRFNVDVDQEVGTSIVNVTVTDTGTPKYASMVATRVAEKFRDEDANRETGGAKEAYDKLTKQIEELRDTIYSQQKDLLAGQQEAGLSLIDKGNELTLSRLQTLLDAWRKAQIEVSEVQQQLGAAEAAVAGGQVLSITKGNAALEEKRATIEKLRLDSEDRLRKIDEKIDEKAQRKSELLTKYTPQYRDVKAVDAELTTLKQQKSRVQDEVTAKIKDEQEKLVTGVEKEVLTGLRTQLNAAQARESHAKQLYDVENAKANVEGRTTTKLGTLQSELKQNEELLNTYIQRQKEQELAILTERPQNIKVQSIAGPAALVGPARTRNILVALFLSLAAGIGLAFLLDYLDDSVRTSDDISRHLGLPTLALIPQHTSGDKKKLIGAKNGTAALAHSNGTANTALITMGDRHSPMAEAYRHLRTSLLFSSAGKPPQTILVTSSQPSEGKTTTAINTAITLAQSDAEVVIVDCDLRRPRLHNHFGLDNSQGLTNYLSGDRNTENLIRTYADLPQLKVITSGPIPPNPAELLSSKEMRNLLQFLTGRFKHVIIDSPPAISFTDASILATQVDGVVLVAMANKSSLHLMRQFKQRVTAIGARIYGVVLNGLKADSQDYYYYYGSGYTSYYSQSEDDSTPYLEDIGK